MQDCASMLISGAIAGEKTHGAAGTGSPQCALMSTGSAEMFR